MASTPLGATRYAFAVDIFNELSGSNEEFHLYVFTPSSGTGGGDEVELYDPRRKRVFLKRCRVPGLALADVAVGSRVSVAARQYRVLDYLDDATRRALATSKERAVVLLPLGGGSAAGALWAAVEEGTAAAAGGGGLRVVNAGLVTLTDDDAAAVSDATVSPVPAGVPLLALDAQGLGAHDTVAALAASGAFGAAVATARDTAADEALTRQLFSLEPAERLPSARAPAGVLRGCACVVVLPAAVARRQAGAVLRDLLEELERTNNNNSSSSSGGAAAATSVSSSFLSSSVGVDSPTAGWEAGPLRLSALRVTSLSRSQAERFLEVYKGVVPEYSVSGGCGRRVGVRWSRGDAWNTVI